MRAAIPGTKIEARIRGQVRVLDPEGNLIVGFNAKTDASKDVMKGLLMRNFRDKALSYIALGTGGGLEATPPHNDTGARVAPDPAETEMRALVEKIQIQTAREEAGDVILVAVARPEQAQDPDINEFGLLTEDGTLFAHFVTEANPGPRAKKYPKTDVYWIIEWPLEYDHT
jgi:hypothetical protein